MPQIPRWLEHTGRALDFHDVQPLDDPDTVALLARGDTMGVFYVESPAMRQLQQKTRRGEFEHLVLHSSIIRPAANAFIREYVRRLHGGTWEPLYPEFQATLRGSYGIRCRQRGRRTSCPWTSAGGPARRRAGDQCDRSGDSDDRLAVPAAVNSRPLLPRPARPRSWSARFRLPAGGLHYP